jgi:hypothetical protein
MFCHSEEKKTETEGNKIGTVLYRNTEVDTTDLWHRRTSTWSPR